MDCGTILDIYILKTTLDTHSDYILLTSSWIIKDDDDDGNDDDDYGGSSGDYVDVEYRKGPNHSWSRLLKYWVWSEKMLPTK